MHRLKSTSRPLLSYVASAPPCWLRLQLMAISDPPIRHVSRFPRGSRNLASRIGVRGEEESGKPDSRRIISSTKDIMISLGEHSQRIKNVENSNTTKEFIASYSYGRPASGEDGRTTMDAICGDQEYHRKIVEVTDGKRKTWGKWDVVLVDTDSRETKVRRGEIMVGGDEENVSCTAEIHGCSVDRVVPLNILPDSSHRDGSIYRDTSGWKKDFRIVDRRESFPAQISSLMNYNTCRDTQTHPQKPFDSVPSRYSNAVYMRSSAMTRRWFFSRLLCVVTLTITPQC